MSSEQTKNIQNSFIEKIKAAIPQNENLVQSIADVLNISVDSAYRRIRGEKLFNINEVALLCSTLKINFDSNINANSNQAYFNFNNLEHDKTKFKNWLNAILDNLKQISARPENSIIYSADDVPIWHHFNDDLLIRFKLFYWLKTILCDADFIDKKFDTQLIPEELVTIAKEVSHYYNQTTSTEIWTEDTFNSTLKQVEYFWDSGFFNTQKDAFDVCSSIKNEITLLQKMCEKSSKLENGKENFTMYCSEVMVGNNSIVAQIGSTKLSYVSYNTFNMMITANASFVNEAEEWLKNLMKKSILISGISEKQRNQFFNKIHQKIDKLEQSIKVDA
ncbi:MAG: hypothetical protein V4620_11985 [Bacteroidota bacterium]